MPLLAPIQGEIAAHVARIRYKRLQPATAGLLENFGIAPVQQPRISKTGAVCTGAMPRKFPNLVHLGDALRPFWP